MSRYLVAAALGAALFADAGAANPGSPPGAASGAASALQGSCMERSKTMCSDYAGQSPQTLKDTESMCVKPPPAGTGGAWSATAPCPSAGRFGRCVKTLAGMTTTQHFYGKAAKETQDFCKNTAGAWKDG